MFLVQSLCFYRKWGRLIVNALTVNGALELSVNHVESLGCFLVLQARNYKYMVGVVFSVFSIICFTATRHLVIATVRNTTKKQQSLSNSNIDITSSHLITSSTARLEHLSVVSATVDASILVEVNQVYQEIVTNLAHKAAGVPTSTLSGTRSKNSNLSKADVLTTTKTNL